MLDWCGAALRLAGRAGLVALTCVWVVSAQAVCHWPAPKLCQTLFESDLVVRARVARVVAVPDGDEGVAGWRYHLVVHKTYRGHAPRHLVVGSDNTTDRLVLKPGREYVVFASDLVGQGYVASGNCEGVQTSDGERYRPGLDRAIARALTQRRAYIGGEVVDGEGRALSLTGLSVVAQSGAGAERAVAVDARGHFRVWVAPGRYRLRLPEGGAESSYSFYDIDHTPLRLAPGQCVQVQLTRRQPAP